MIRFGLGWLALVILLAALLLWLPAILFRSEEPELSLGMALVELLTLPALLRGLVARLVRDPRRRPGLLIVLDRVLAADFYSLLSLFGLTFFITMFLIFLNFVFRPLRGWH